MICSWNDVALVALENAESLEDIAQVLVATLTEARVQYGQVELLCGPLSGTTRGDVVQNRAVLEAAAHLYGNMDRKTIFTLAPVLEFQNDFFLSDNVGEGALPTSLYLRALDIACVHTLLCIPGYDGAIEVEAAKRFAVKKGIVVSVSTDKNFPQALQLSLQGGYSSYPIYRQHPIVRPPHVDLPEVRQP